MRSFHPSTAMALAAATLACLALTPGADAGLTERDSTEFVNDAGDNWSDPPTSLTAGYQTAHMEGDVSPQGGASVPRWEAQSGPTNTIEEGILTLDTLDPEGEDNGYWRSTHTDYGNFWSQDADPALGYTVEIRLRVIAVEGSLPAMAIITRDGSHQMQVNFGDGSVTFGTEEHVLDTSTFHTYRLAKKPNANAYNFWVDGKLDISHAHGRSSSGCHLSCNDFR